MDTDVAKKQIEDSCEQIMENWEHTNLLEGVSKKNKQNLAVILSNQNLFNKNFSRDGDDNFKRISIPLVRKVFGGIVEKNIIGFQAMIAPTSFLFYEEVKEKKSNYDEVLAKTKRLKTFFPDYEFKNIDSEAELVASLAWDIEEEIWAEILTDLVNNSGTVAKAQTSLDVAIQEVSNAILVKTKHGPNWLVTTPQIIEKISNLYNYRSIDEEKTSTLHQVGILEGMRVYTFDKFPENKILMGFRGNNEQSGYFYCPYIPFGIIENKFLTRYTKRLIENGSKYYGTISME
jgi:hypothetical protein